MPTENEKHCAQLYRSSRCLRCDADMPVESPRTICDACDDIAQRTIDQKKKDAMRLYKREWRRQRRQQEKKRKQAQYDTLVGALTNNIRKPGGT